MHDWLSMGGYAPYVWGAYALALVGLGGLTFWAIIGHRAAARAAKDAGITHLH